MSTCSYLEMIEQMDGELEVRRTQRSRISNRSYSPRHQRRRSKSAQLHNGAHRRRQKHVCC